MLASKQQVQRKRNSVVCWMLTVSPTRMASCCSSWACFWKLIMYRCRTNVQWEKKNCSSTFVGFCHQANQKAVFDPFPQKRLFWPLLSIIRSRMIWRSTFVGPILPTRRLDLSQWRCYKQPRTACICIALQIAQYKTLNIEARKRVNSLTSVNVFWNETAFPLCKATDNCWHR